MATPLDDLKFKSALGAWPGTSPPKASDFNDEKVVVWVQTAAKLIPDLIGVIAHLEDRIAVLEKAAVEMLKPAP